jgi:hypothetical protein
MDDTSHTVHWTYRLSAHRQSTNRRSLQTERSGIDQIDRETQRELRQKGLCYSCRKSWQSGHRCLEDGQVHFDSDEEAKGMTITSLANIPSFHTFRVRGGVHGQRVMILIDGGATHNFVDSGLVKRLGLPTIDIGDFRVFVIGRQCPPPLREVMRRLSGLGTPTRS